MILINLYWLLDTSHLQTAYLFFFFIKIQVLFLENVAKMQKKPSIIHRSIALTFGRDLI